jgi:predicted SAM-dependent methyltransferase
MPNLRPIVSSALNLLYRPFGRVRFRRALDSRPDANCLEFGAWSSRREDWIVTDISWRCPNFLDVSKPWPVDNNRFDFVFSDNVIEHLRLDQARFAFRESFRVLRPGGRIRFVTPDIGSLVEVYLSPPDMRRDLADELMGDGYMIEHPVDLLRFAFQDDGHSQGYLWDRESIAAELSAAGFADVEFCLPGNSEYEQFRGIDSRTVTPLARSMLAVEASKPLIMHS